MTWLLLLSIASAREPRTCLTPDLLPGKPPLLREDAPSAPPSSGKSTRDPYNLPNSRASDNFIVRWGSGGGVSTSDVDVILDAFEWSWDVEIGDMDHPAPSTTNTYKFNVYVGDTGSGAPSAGGNSGYYYTDRQGYPYIVLAKSSVSDPEWGSLTAAHEFYHAIQDTAGSFSYSESGPGAWFWEATASWMESEVYPSSTEYAAFLFGYAYLPHYPVGFFDYPDTGTLQEYHAYGAFIFPRYLSEHVGDWRIVRNAWVDPQRGTTDPIEAMRYELEDLGEDLDEAFVDFAAHNAVWDYQHGTAYEWDVDGYEDYYTSHEVAAEVGSTGTPGWASVSSSLLPQRYGYNIISLSRPSAGDFVLSFRGDSQGSRSHSAHWGVKAVMETNYAVDYLDMSLSGNEGELTIEGANGYRNMYLVVAAWSDTLTSGETFGYDYKVDFIESTPDPGDDPGDDPDTGSTDTGSTDTGDGQDQVHDGGHVSFSDGESGAACGCAAGRGAGAWLALLGLVGVARRRR